MPILHLILGHMLADFVLQPFKLVRWKYRARSGVFLHSLVHFVVYLLIFAHFLPDLRVIAVITGLSAAHFLIDGLKIDTEKKGSRFPSYFLLDQLIHLLTLVAGGLVIGDILPNGLFGGGGEVNMAYFMGFYNDFYIVLGLILLIFSTYAVEMFMYQQRRMAKPGAVFKPDYIAMLKRGAIFIVIYALMMVLP